jgi:macrodomain Ter protein organizer (MatP/YcbG family)
MYADDQVAELMSLPNIPTNVIEAAKQFPDHVKRIEKSKAQERISNRRAVDREKLVKASQSVDQDHRRLEELSALVESGKKTSASVIDEVQKIESRLQAAQRQHAALENSEAQYAAIEADPVAYFDQFYSTYPGLRDRRVNLRDYLAERGLSR